MIAREFQYSYLDFRDKPLTRKGSLAYKLRRYVPRNYMYNEFWLNNSLRFCANKTPNSFYIKANNSMFSKYLTKRMTDNLLTYR
jgi:hypothetical protein